MNERSVTQVLHDTVANWYVVLRNLAIIALLSVLLYVGIRMVISSTAADKAKYKQMFMDWIIALCILFFLHYLMSFILTMVDNLVEGIKAANSDIVVGIYTDENCTTLATSEIKLDDGSKASLMFKTDLTGLCRLLVQSSDMSVKLVYLIFYIALVIYTVMFTWTYVKRAITMAFLTLVAPVVAITYPIDKMKDGQAQAFNIWLKEFIFNALLQPFHLIIYTIFLGSSMEIATKNPIYAILFLAFIIPSEKLLRKMFGFNNSETVGAMGTAAGLFGGAAVLRGAGSLVNKIRGGGKSGKGNDNKDTKKPVRTKNPISTTSTPSLASAFGNGSAQGGAPSGRTVPTRGRVVRRQSRSQAANPNGNAAGIISQQTQNRQRAMNQANRRNLVVAIRISIANANQTPPSGTRPPATYRNTGQNTARNLANTQRPNRHRGRGILRATGHVLGGLGKFAGKAALTTVGAGIGATVGLAAGIAGDDLEDVLKLGAAGTALGATAIPALGHSVASGAVNLATNTIPNIGRGIRDSYEEGAYNPIDLAERRQTRELMQDDDYRLQMYKDLQSDLGRDPTKQEVTEKDERRSGIL